MPVGDSAPLAPDSRNERLLAPTASALQVRVRDAITALGGYWPPANAAVRLLEELGELAEHDLDPLLGSGALAGECADLWIITTAMADQFYAYVEAPRRLASPPPDGPQQLAELVAAGGRVGRIVNFYDGPKTPRSFDGWISIEQAVAAFHQHLVAFATARGVDLNAAIERTLELNISVDAARFAATFDPRTAPVLTAFAEVVAGPAYPYPGETRLFGAPDWSPIDDRASVEAIAAAFGRFNRAAAPERLDGFVIPGPDAVTDNQLATWSVGLRAALAIEPEHHTAMAFSPLQAADDARWSQRGTFLLIRRADS